MGQEDREARFPHPERGPQSVAGMSPDGTVSMPQIGGVEPQIRPSISLQSLETCDLLIPDSPIACTRSSTRRVDTPAIQASWITATHGMPRG